MFNPLPHARLVAILSTVLRDSAGWDRPLEPFQTGQLKSASSIGRFAAAELAHAEPVLERFRELVREIAEDAPDDVAELGAYLSDLMAELPDGPALTSLKRLLLDLCEAEVLILTSANKEGNT